MQTSTRLNDYLDFPYVRQVARVTRQRLSVKEGETTETVYLITSLAEERADPKRLLALNRGHWAIENRLHWVRDVTFDEDRSTVRTRQGPRLMASLRNLAISLLRLIGTVNLAAKLRELAAKPHKILRLLGV
ncbi:MAG: ISAs1 family transposase [Gammaproteobacteria bacterium]